MNSAAAVALLSHALEMAALICAPILIVTLVVGVLVSVIQVVTQIQDMSLSFVPKLIAVVVAFIAFGGWMLMTLVGYAARLIGSTG